MKRFCIRTLAILLSVGLLPIHVFAQEDQAQQLRQARENYVQSTQDMSAAEKNKKQKVVFALLAIGGLQLSVGAGFLAKKVLDSGISMKRKGPAMTSLDLCTAQASLSANLRQGEKYMVSQLGEEMMPVVQQLFERWKETYVYEVKSVIKESSERVFQVQAGMEREFVEKIVVLYEDFMSKATIDGNSLLTAGERGITSYTKSLQEQFEKIVLEEMRSGRSLSAYVKPIHAKTGQTAAQRAGITAAKRLGSVGKLVFRKSLPFVALALVLGATHAQASDAEMLRRVDQNPTLLLEVDDATFEVMLQSPQLVERGLEVYDAWQRINELSDDEIDFLYENLAPEEKMLRTLQQRELQKALRNLNRY